jgi:hypothetical protein
VMIEGRGWEARVTCMYVCICIYIRIHMYVCMHMYIHTHTHSLGSTSNVCVCMHMYMHTYTQMHMYMHTYTQSLYVYICIHIRKHTAWETGVTCIIWTRLYFSIAFLFSVSAHFELMTRHSRLGSYICGVQECG